MANFIEGHTYILPEENEYIFLGKSSHNSSMLDEIKANGPGFTVLETLEEFNGYSCTSVQFEGTGKISLDGFYLTTDERDYFIDVTPGKGQWVYGALYKCKDLTAISRSFINFRFVKEVGNKAFKITKMMNDFERTSEIEYLNDNGESKTMKITFIPAELRYFELISEGDEIESPLCSIESLEDQIESVEESEEWNAEVEGVMVFRIESEAERKQAIEILKTTKWKK